MVHKVDIKPAVDREADALLARLLAKGNAGDVLTQIAVVLQDRKAEWSDVHLAAVHKVLADIMWDRV